jgi:peptidoglycan LD-endopeptidase LytH
MTILFLILFQALSNSPDTVTEWIHFEKAVRDQTIGKAEAQKQFPPLYKELKELCKKHQFKQHAKWQFPVQGYGIKDMGSDGFRPDIRYGSSPIKGYNFYDGNKHGGHPAYDIFIRDRNQDSADDKTLKPVMVIAPVDLLIVSVEKEWAPNSEIRGGRYIWALDPLTDRIFYFAHLNEVRITAGVFCPAGSAIGTVGRSGKNAYPSRSETHLHFMVLEIKGSALSPLDYRALLK